VGANDLWIAACAIRHNLTLLTNNQKDSEGIPELKLISAPPQAKTSAAAPNLFPRKANPEQASSSMAGSSARVIDTPNF
jgi:hypothetical protein